MEAEMEFEDDEKVRSNRSSSWQRKFEEVLNGGSDSKKCSASINQRKVLRNFRCSW